MLRRSVLTTAIAAWLATAAIGAASASAAQFASISAGGTSTCGATSTGELFCWGDGRASQLGRLSAASARSPVHVIGTYDSEQVSVGTEFACQLLQRGNQISVRGVFACWGSNAQGQVGNDRQDSAQYPQEMSAPSGLTRLEAGDATACALGPAGTAYCWGDDSIGQLGDGSAVTLSRTPQQVTGVSGLVDLALGNTHVCGARNDGALICWGWTANGRTGLRVGAPIIVPTVVPGLTDVVGVAAGAAHTCALRRDGTVWCFGLNDSGQIGVGGALGGEVPTPTQVPGLSGITRIDAGGNSTCAVGGGGTVFCWGDGLQGKLGNGGRTASTTPVRVVQISDVVQLSVGTSHVCVLTSKGAPYCWGSNRYGQLGNGERTGPGVFTTTPRRVLDSDLGRATFIPRAFQSFPTGTNGGTIELRDLVVRKVSSHYRCPSKGTLRISANGHSALRAVPIGPRSTTSCRVSGSFALPSLTDGATVATYALRATHLRTKSGSLRAQSGS